MCGGACGGVCGGVCGSVCSGAGGGVCGGVCGGPAVEGLIASCLQRSAVVPGGAITLSLGGGLEEVVVTPGEGVPPTNYADHVRGMMSSEMHREQQCSSSIRYTHVTHMHTRITTCIYQKQAIFLPRKCFMLFLVCCFLISFGRFTL